MGTNLAHLGDFPTLGEISLCISAPPEPPFATSNPSTGYNIKNMFLMDSVYSVCQKSIRNWLLGEQTCAPSGNFPTLGGIPLASQHLTGHPLLPATPVLDITSRPCSPWILHTLFARNPSRTDSLVCRYVPLEQVSHIGEKIPCISASHRPPFAPSDPSTGYNINNIFSMNSVYSVGQR